MIVPSRAVAVDLGTRRLPRVVHPGVDLDRLEARGAPAAPPEVLVLGSIVGWKRADLALEVFAIARSARPDVRLRIVGAPPPPQDVSTQDTGLLARLQRRASAPDLAGAVEFAGPVADPAAELARASVLLHCATREPFGLVMAEALAAGRPVVAPDNAGPREIVDAECGLLYPAGRAEHAASVAWRTAR